MLNSDVYDGGNPGTWTEEERLGFIRKVYGILSTQLIITAAICALPCFSIQARIFFLTHYGLAIVCAVLALALSCVIVCCEGVSRKVPTNYILLFAFTAFEAYSVAFSCAYVKDSLVVLAAAAMTAAVVVSLTLYAVFTTTDFTACGGTIAVIGAVFCVFSLFSFFFGSTMRMIYAVVGVIIFGIYLIFDTQYIVGGERRQYSISKEDYILGAMILYLDIINIFLFLLEIFGGKKDD